MTTDGVSPVEFSSSADRYYVAVAHQSHLGIITANTIALPNTGQNLDLTADTALIDGGINALNDMSDGYFALSAGLNLCIIHAFKNRFRPMCVATQAF